MTEEWKAVRGYEGLYEVSDQGRVRSLARVVRRGQGYQRIPDRLLKLVADELDRKQVTLVRDGVHKNVRVHSLVATAFIGPRPDGQDCRHLDGDCLNNHVSNLAWGTRSENNLDQVQHSTHRQTQKTICPLGHVLAQPNLRRASLANGMRACRACAIARSSRYYGDRHKPQADKIYARIMEGNGAPMRPFGWSDDAITAVKTEADELRAMATHLIDGGGLRPLAADLNNRGVLTVTGKQWQTITIKRALVNPRMIGMREKDGALIPTNAEPILDQDTFDKLVALFNDPERTKYARENKTPSLLSGGIARCGLCGTQMYGVTAQDRARLYKCTPPPSGCGRVSVKAEDLESEIVEGVLARLTDAGYRKALQGAVNALSTPQAAEKELAELRTRLDALGEDYADGLIERQQMRAGTERLRARIAQQKLLIERQTTLADIPEPTVEKILKWWEDASAQRRRDVVAVILDHVTVKPSTGRIKNGIHPDRLHYEWKTT